LRAWPESIAQPVRTLTEALDLTMPTGRVMAGTLAVFAEFQRDLLRERLRPDRAIAKGPPAPATSARDCVRAGLRVKNGVRRTHTTALTNFQTAARAT